MYLLDSMFYFTTHVYMSGLRKRLERLWTG